MSQLEKIRHSTEHVLMQAMENLYGNKITKAMGPAIEDGFYFDFDSHPGFSISKEDFPKLEKEMQKIIDKDLPITQQEISPEEARQLFKNNPYKQEWIDQAQSRGEKLSIYWTGKPENKDSFVDLCKGPHLNSTGEISTFKLLSVAGAYWHGDEKNQMLTRIYGTAFKSEKNLDKYLEQKRQAEKRDHKKLGKKLDLFMFSKLVGPGLPMWTPKGTKLRQLLDNYVSQLRNRHDYQAVEIPHISKKGLYEQSGHWDKFKDELFKIQSREDHQFALKPMNCPHHIQIYKRKLHSYRDLPQRYCNTTMVYRDEQTGELSGLSRVRSLTQDDSHVFCRLEQIKQEMGIIWDIIDEFYSIFNFDLDIHLSLHDPDKPEEYLGDKQEWQQAEDILREIAKDRGVDVKEKVGEAAFYGPKIDFIAKDSLGREWQVGTNQLDMNLPERFDLTCINQDGEEERIYMVHAAIMGSIERFISILIEHLGGNFPVWLSPLQVEILTISENQTTYANNILMKFKENNLRAQLNQSDQSLGKKIRDAERQKTPYMIIIGQKEVDNNQISVRQRGENDLGVMSLSKFIDLITKKIDDKAIE